LIKEIDVFRLKFKLNTSKKNYLSFTHA